LPGAPIRLLQPAEVAELPDDAGIEWAPIAPYWAVLWRSGVALARELAGRELDGLRVLELGCGLGLPSLAAARNGATVLATDAEDDALALLARNAASNGIELRAMRADWTEPLRLLQEAPFDLVVAGDVLYEAGAPEQLALLVPQLARRLMLADPGRPGVESFLKAVAVALEPVAPPRPDGVVCLYELEARN
jgi:predicted nicotinamide N-methyase